MASGSLACALIFTRGQFQLSRAGDAMIPFVWKHRLSWSPRNVGHFRL